MTKTRKIIQKECVEILQKHGYKGTINIDPGVGKSKIVIDIIKKEKKFNEILITSPRTNLQSSWKKQLDKWGLKQEDKDNPNVYTDDDGYVYIIDIVNIQTCYKWSEERLNSYNLIVLDEIHTIVTPEYGKILEIISEKGTPRIGLTATLDIFDNDEKKNMYDNYCPVVYKYKTASKDGIINKRKYKVISYSLSDNYFCLVKTKRNVIYKQSEKKRYEYLDNMMKESREKIQNFYFEEIKKRANIAITSRTKNPAYIAYIKNLISNDLHYFREKYWTDMKEKKHPYDLYLILRYIYGTDYAKTGMKAGYYCSLAPKEIKPSFFMYIWARNKRKELLCSLDSSKDVAVRLKNKILKADNNNKVLLFSELTEHSERLSSFSVHSNKRPDENQQLLDMFDKGEIRELSSVRSLTLGLNLKNPNYAIMESYNSSSTQFEQKAGRTNRLPVADTATIIWIVPKNTQAEEWFKKAYKTVTEEDNVEYIDLDKTSIEKISI